MRAIQILVADDNHDFGENVAEIFADLGCAVDCVQDGAEAVRAIDSKRYDLLVLDVRMPHRNGIEVYEAARRLDPGVKAVFMTAHASDDLFDKARARGFHEVVLKPPASGAFERILERFRTEG